MAGTLGSKPDKNRANDVTSDRRGGDSSRDQTNPSVSTKESDIDYIQGSIHDYKQRLRGLEYHNDHLVEANQRLEDELRDFESQTEESNRDIAFVDQDLGATRFHAPNEDTMTNTQLVQEFTQVLKSVDSLVKDLDSWYHDSIHVPLSTSKVRAITETFSGDIGKEEVAFFLTGALHAKKGLGDIFRVLMHYYACSSLLEHVFRPFVPGGRGDETTTLLNIQSLVQEKEPQSSSGRWRALTYRTALESRSTSWHTAPATQFAEHFNHILETFANLKLDGKAFRSAAERTETVFKIATDFKDKAMMMCTEMDFHVYLPSSKQRINPTVMNEVWSGRPSETVSLGVGLGLEIYRRRQKGSGSTQEKYIAVRSVVIGSRSHLFPPARSYIASFLGM